MDADVRKGGNTLWDGIACLFWFIRIRHEPLTHLSKSRLIPGAFIDRARSTPTSRPISRVNNRQIYSTLYPSLRQPCHDFLSPRSLRSLSLSRAFSLFALFSFISITSRSRADRSSRGRQTSFISSLVNETIYQRLCQNCYNKNCYKTLASHERFCIARFAMVYTRIGDTSSIFLVRARRSGSNAAGDESWYPRNESR